MENLALYGGEKVKNTPFAKGKRFGEEELRNLEEALNQNTLFYWKGNLVKKLTAKFAEMYGVPYCVATTSGTASIHVALGALGVTAGDEVITSPITDMGTIIGIIYQNAIPVFADLDPNSYNMDPASIEAKITDKTKAIVVVHLAGAPADMDPIMEIAKRHNLKVIEDCAQSYMTRYKGRLCGTIGDAGCFSLNDFKHISAGDGGMVIMKDENLYHTALRFADKNYQRITVNGQADRQIPFIAPNYRMNELTGAVGLAQLDKVEWICEQRHKMGERVSEALRKLPGLTPPKIYENSYSSYWFYLFRIDEEEAGVSREEFCNAVSAEGVPCTPGYIPHCVYEYDMFANQEGYRSTNCPFKCPLNDRTYTYGKGLCPQAEEILQTAVRVEINEFYSEQDIQDTINAITKVSNYFYHRKNK